MSFCDIWIQNICSNLPENCRTEDLVKAGIYHSAGASCMARKKGNCPPYIRIGGKIIYPKDGVIQWLKDQKNEKST